MERWNYTLFVEGDLPQQLAVRLDAELSNNPHYALCRGLGQLGPLTSFRIAHDAYGTFCRVSADEGRRVGEIKPQALSSRSDWSRHFSAVL